MTRAELIGRVASRLPDLHAADVESAVRNILDQMSAALARRGRIEVRGFGSFSVRHRPSRRGRNPKTGESVVLAGKHVPHFKPGGRLRERVEEARRRGTGGAAGLPRWSEQDPHGVASGGVSPTRLGGDT